MKICELRLKNVKCYEDKTINFQDGINFISGVNGAGKTTIIEAIGLVLFDHFPYKKVEQFVREGKKSGEIQLVLEAKDERLYRIIRKFNTTAKSVKWEVYDQETETVLEELHGGKDVTRWIKENIGIDAEDSLEKIYGQVIAVDQGLFTTPFLETSSNRKKTFDEILKVEGYRQAFEQSKSINRFIEGHENKLKVTVDHLEEDIAKMPEVEEDISNKEKELKEQANKLEELKIEQKKLEETDAEWTKLKEETDAKNNEKRLLEQQLSSIEETIKSLMKQKEEAQKARIIVEENKEAYERYLENQKELKTWEEKKKEKDARQAVLDKKEKYHSTEEKGIEVEVKNLKTREAELTTKLDDLNKQKGEISKKLEEANEDLTQVTSWQEKSAEAAEPYDALATWFEKKQEIVNDVFYRLQGLEDLEKQIEEIKDKVRDLPQWEEDLAELASSIKRIEEILKEKSALEARKDSLKQNETHLLEGRCPIIQESCPSPKVDGNLGNYFAKELEEIEAGLKDLEVELKQEKERKELYDKLAKDIDWAKNEDKRRQEQEKKREGKLKEVGQLLKSVPLAEISELIAKGKTEYSQLESSAKEISTWLEVKDFITQESFSIEGLLVATEYSSLLAEMDELKLDNTKLIRDWLTKWDQLEAELKRWLEKRKAEVHEFKQWLQGILQDVNTKKQTLEGDQRHCQKAIDENQTDINNLTKQKADLQARKEKLVQVQEEIVELKKELIQFADVEEKVDTLKQEIEKDQPNYDKYNANKQTSDRLEKVEQEIAVNQDKVKHTDKKSEKLNEELKELSKKYDVSRHEKLKTELKELNNEVNKLEISLEQTQLDIEKLRKERDKLLKKKEEWEETKKKLRVKEKTRELAKTVRETLRDAADPIADVYRKHLSAQANEIYRNVSNENVQVDWAEEYELQLKDNHNSKERTRVFKQLSGGEQMTAALAIRLSLMQMLSDVNIGFFDEPTTNLDVTRRQNLAMAIQNSTQGFDQLFVISHDDAFEAMMESTISLEKDDGEGTKVKL